MVYFEISWNFCGNVLCIDVEDVEKLQEFWKSLNFFRKIGFIVISYFALNQTQIYLSQNLILTFFYILFKFKIFF